MVPLLAILTIIGFLAVDLAVQALAARRRAKVGKELKLGPSQPLSWNVTVPDGFFLSPGHTWAYLEHNGNVRVGMDDFGRQMMGVPEAMDFPRLGTELRRGEPMATVYIGSRLAHLPAPVDGIVEDVNTPMIIHPAPVDRDPYVDGWMLKIKPKNLAQTMTGLHVAEEAKRFMKDEVERFRSFVEGRLHEAALATAADGGAPVKGIASVLGQASWDDFRRQFLNEDLT